MQKPSLTLIRCFKAPPAKVFSALTDPAMIVHWFGGPSPEGKSVQSDLRPGGQYHLGFVGQDGEANDVYGAYREIVADQRLVFSWHWRTTPERESLVTIDLKPLADGTEMTLTHEQFYDEAARDNHQRGWGYGLDALQALVEA
jgi:uncharacterized protein YndB with AHSA1/START domain